MSLKIKTVSTGSLTSDKANARRHSDRNLDILAKSLAEFGQRKPIVVSADNVVLAGNGTLEAAKRLGWKTISVVTIPVSWTVDEARAFALADNRTAELAKWDGTVLAAQLEQMEIAGFAPEVLGFNLASSPTVQQNQTSEIDIDSFSFQHECPDCGFEFDAR